MEKEDLWEEWEILTKDGLLEFPKPPVFNPIGTFESNYFDYPDRRTAPPEQSPDGELVKEIREVPAVEVRVTPPAVMEKIKPSLGGDQDTFSQIFFKKLKETEFDMKIDSPQSTAKELRSHFEVGSFLFEEEDNEYAGEDFGKKTPKASELELGKNYGGSESKEKGFLGAGGLPIWKWRIPGVGALCSVGVAAATVFIFLIGSRQRSKQQHQNQKPYFPIYSDEKRMKEVVHHAAKLNQVLGGLPLTRASITFGGYYNGLQL